MIIAVSLFPKSINTQRLEKALSKQIKSLESAEGLISLQVSKGDLMSPAGPPEYQKVVQVGWESLEDMMAWVQTPAAQDDKQFFIENGAVLLFYEVKDLTEEYISG